MESNRFTVYVIKSVYDKKVENEFPLREYEKELQVGAALTDARICELQDNNGDNISGQNRQYCELTGLYWIWKHSIEEYIGISHYRRRFDISPEVIKNIDEISADVVVTVPVINTAGIGRQYGLTHSKEDWVILREEVHNHSPQYDNSFVFVEKQMYFHGYNMFIMKRRVLNEFCEWLFPILFSCEARIGIKDDPYQNRYLGFMSERLLNVFLYHNKGRFKIFISGKKYLE